MIFPPLEPAEPEMVFRDHRDREIWQSVLGTSRRDLAPFHRLSAGSLAAAGPGYGGGMNAPECSFPGLDSLWIQVAGSSPNLRCVHCFNASGPGKGEMPSPFHRPWCLRYLLPAWSRVRERRDGRTEGVALAGSSPQTS